MLYQLQKKRRENCSIVQAQLCPVTGLPGLIWANTGSGAGGLKVQHGGLATDNSKTTPGLDIQAYCAWYTQSIYTGTAYCA